MENIDVTENNFIELNLSLEELQLMLTQEKKTLYMLNQGVARCESLINCFVSVDIIFNFLNMNDMHNTFCKRNLDETLAGFKSQQLDLIARAEMSLERKTFLENIFNKKRGS